MAGQARNFFEKGVPSTRDDVMNENVLILILSIGFIVLILFVLIAVGAMIKILLDVKSITGTVKKETENFGETFEAVSSKAKSFFTNSVVSEKVIPLILGAISAGVAYKKTTNDDGCDCGDTEEEKKSTHAKAGQAKKKRSKKTKIFTEEEID